MKEHNPVKSNTYKSSQNFDGEYEVIIIGGGVVGTSIAREFSRYNLRISLIEKEDELSFGVSKANSGIVHAGIHSRAALLKEKLCARGNFLYNQLKSELGIPFKRVGELLVVKEGEDVNELLKFKSMGEENGVPGLKILSREEIREIEPALSKEIIAALYAPSAGVVNPYELVYLLAQNAIKNGVEIKTGEEVISINDRIVQTTKGKYKTQFIINAAGLFADRISNMVGIFDFKIVPRKGEEYLLDKKLRGLVSHIIFPLPSKNSKGTLVIPTLDGTIMVGPSAHEIENKYDLKTSDDVCWQIFEKARQMIPAIHSKHLISTFAGNRPVPVSLKPISERTPAELNEDFIINATPVPGFINVVGIQSPGLTAAPAIAERVVEIVKEEGLELIPSQSFVAHLTPTKKLREMSDLELEKEVRENPDYGKIVCRCEMVSEGEMKQAIASGAKTLDGVKFRTRAGMGRCQGGFCSFRTIEILAEELNVSPLEITKKGAGSNILVADITHRKSN